MNTQSILVQINEATDKVLAAFWADNEIIFANDKERTILKYKFKQEWQEEWKTSKKCIYAGCTAPSIIRSHTVQRAGSLEVIAENDKVLTPHFHPDREEMVMQEDSTRSASTFPGFCTAHEKLFEAFETAKELTEPQHFRLQVYRTVCREVVKNHAILREMEQRREQYVQHRNSRLRELIAAELGEGFLTTNKVTLQSTDLEMEDHRLAGIDHHLDLMRNNLNGFLLRFQAAILQDINNGKDPQTHAVVIGLDMVIPVTLAGRGNFTIGKTDGHKNVDVILNVLPFADRTVIVISGLMKDEDAIDAYGLGMKNALVFISAIESWMVHGSDHWFIKPSAWHMLGGRRAAQLLIDLHDISKNIGHPYAASIFDEPRRQCLDFLSGKRDEWTDAHRNQYEHEKGKLADSQGQS